MVKKAPQTTKVKSKVVTRNATPVRNVVRASTKVSSHKKVVSRASRSSGGSLARYGKRTLRAILLSRTLHIASKALIMLVVTSGALYGAYSLVSNTFAGDVVISKSEIVARVGRLTTVPNTTPDAVVRVQDAETLRKQNTFYQDVKEGDYIIMYPTLAVIYSLRSDSLVNIKRIETR
jgi:hypothetical protein